MNHSPISRNATAATALAALLLTTGCAIGNSGKLVLARHVSIGQELMDLHQALQTGAMTQEEYELVKGKLMTAVEQLEIVDTVNGATPDQINESLAD